MTEQLFPDDQADGVVDGTLADVPASLQGVAGVLGAARAEASAEELSGMAAAVRQFAAAVATPPTARSRSMFSYRLTKRSAAVVIATLLTAGTAAAAAGGVLSPSSDDPIAIDETSTTESTVDGTTTTEMPGDTTTTEVPGGTSTTDVATTTGEDEDEDGRGPDATGPAAKGLCTAWTNGAPKNTSNPAFGALQDAAEQAGLTIDEYCAQVLADHDDDDDEADDEADHDDADHDDDQSGDDGDHDGKGGDNGKGGDKGKSEDQHGNSGNHG